MVGKILGGRYELLEKVGGGGMAIVYKAKCHLLKRHVAVKILRPELVENEEFVARFKRESQSAASLSHHNIVNIYDVGQEDDIHYIVMEYVDGQTLKEYIKGKGVLNTYEACRIAMQICSALSHAHKNNIVHRDIKPQNILMDREGNAKVADFGIARAVTSATVTMAGANIIGSVHYFSPEQARGGYVDKKSDIYSLGIVLYEMVTGIVPFEGDSAISVALKHIQDKVKPAGEINPNLPKSIQYIIEKAIEKDLDQRYESAEAMAADLRRFMKDPHSLDHRFEEFNDPQATKVIPSLKNIDIENPHNDKELSKETRKGKNKKKKKGIKVLWSLIAVLFVILVLTGAYLLGRSIFENNFNRPDIKVPRVVNMEESEAERVLLNMGLNMHVRERIFHNQIPKDHVISQDPPDGMSVKKDSNVHVIISKGVETVTMPDVVGLDISQAEIELENKGLTISKVEEVDSEEPVGKVIEQNVPKDTEVELNAEIVLTISKGLENNKVEIRDYTKIMESLARDMILEDGLKYSIAGREYNNDIEHGVVIRQDPEPGTSVDKDSTVNLWVSLGPEPLKDKILKITYNGDEDVFSIRVVRISDGAVVHDELHNASEGIIEIRVQGTGVEEYDIYIDGELDSRIPVDFGGEANN